MLGNPPVLILDEPFSGLDPLQRQDFRNILSGLKEEGKAIIFSSHVLPEVEDIADRVLIIHHGKTRVAADIEQLLSINQQVVISTHGDHDENLSKLVECGDELTSAVVLRANTFVVDIDVSRRADCLKKMVERGIRVTGYSTSKRDLEDVFAEFVSSPAKVD